MASWNFMDGNLWRSDFFGSSLQAGSHLGADARAAKSEFKSKAIQRGGLWWGGARVTIAASLTHAPASLALNIRSLPLVRLLPNVSLLAGYFGSGPGYVSRTQSNPGFVNPVRSGPDFVDPIRSGPGFVNTHFLGFLIRYSGNAALVRLVLSHFHYLFLTKSKLSKLKLFLSAQLWLLSMHS